MEVLKNVQCFRHCVCERDCECLTVCERECECLTVCECVCVMLSGLQRHQHEARFRLCVPGRERGGGLGGKAVCVPVTMVAEVVCVCTCNHGC